MDDLSSAAQQPATPAARAQLMIVEDEPILRSSMARGLARMLPIDVWNAASVAEARQLLERIRPQIVLCDLDLPDGVGLDVLATLDRRGLFIPVIFISAYVSTYQRSIPSRANIQVYEKPITITELRRLVQQQLALTAQEEPPPFSPTDYIQLAAMGKHSVRLEFERGGEPAGTVVIHDGELWSVSDPRGEGEAALRRLMFSGSALTLCTSLREKPGPRAFTTSSQSLLMEAARLEDEEARAEEPAPPPSPAPAPAPAPKKSLCFEELYEIGVDALLRKDYPAALESFSQASALRPQDAKVIANLKRLRALGFAKESGK